MVDSDRILFYKMRSDIGAAEVENGKKGPVGSVCIFEPYFN